MERLFRLSADGITGEQSRPDPAKVIAGDPQFTTWNLEDHDGLYAGLWQSTPGTWRISYDEWEYCKILKGRSVIRGDDGSCLEVGPGDGFVIRPGFQGSWEVIETTVKEYVVRL